ncbi:hypothetical protein ACKWTF_005259 [Chironomus riparius]
MNWMKLLLHILPVFIACGKMVFAYKKITAKKMKKRFNDGICWQEETCKADGVREKNVLWTNRFEISVKKNCIYRSVGAYSCHEDNLTFNIHHNIAMRVHFD